MTTTQSNLPRVVAPPKFENAAEWLHALGDVPPDRIVMDPWPGTATEQDLLLFVERDKRLVELIDGTLVEKPVGMDEAVVAQWVAYHLMTWIVPRKLGVVAGGDGTLRMRNGRVRLPDVSFITTERFAALPRPRPPIPEIGPDLAVEVLSPSNTAREIGQKLQEYFESGTRLAWVIDPPTRTVAVYVAPDRPAHTLSESDNIDGGDVLPGFSVAVAEFFKPLS
jgi:Uma2 family endonuclease